MDRSQAYGDQLDALLAISVEVASLHELAEVEDRALSFCLELTDSRYGFIGLVEPARDQMVIAAIKGYVPPPGFLERYGFMSVRRSVFGIVILEDRPYLSNSVETDPLSVGQPPGHPPIHSFLGIPLRVGATLIGELGVANKPHGFDSDDERLLSMFGNQIAIAIDNARLHAQQREMIAKLVSVVDLATSGRSLGSTMPRPGLASPDVHQPFATQSAGSGNVRNGISDAQREILVLVSEGYSNREIAARIHLSENTVKTHIQEIFRKLGVRNRVEAAIKAVREGLL